MAPPRRLRGKAGRAVGLLALTGTLMIGGVGVAVALAVGYMYSIAAERAASAAALSGVVFMPGQFTSAQAIPAGSRTAATDRAIDEAKRNGFDPANTQEGVVVVPAVISGRSNQLRVTVAKQAPVFFMQLFGFRPYLVARTAVAAYLPPISLGQPGSQAGSSLGELGRTRFFFTREEACATGATHGDANTPTPAGSNDVHQLSYTSGTEPRDLTVADRGGYDYRVTVPSSGPGGVVQVYNAAFAPDGTGGTANFCDNNNQNPAARTCAIGGNNWFHEDDSGPFAFGTAANYTAMRYTLYRINNAFIRGSDELLSQLTVLPIDARNWNGASNQYTIMGGPNAGKTVDQQYSGGLPSNMLIYHNWVDVTSYTGLNDGGLVSLRTTPALNNYLIGGALVAGTYRLRVDSNILDPSGAVATSTQGVNIYDLGVQRSNLQSGNYTVIASAQNGNQIASFVATDTSNGTTRNGRWVHVELPVPSGYNPPPGQYWWSMQYVTGPGTVAVDTVTVAVGLKGGPVHLLP